MNFLKSALPDPQSLLLLLLLLAIPATIVTARQLIPAESSPATGHAQVITQGIATLPEEPLIWRVVQRTAEPRWEAKSSKTVLGFVLASDEPVLLSNIVKGENPLDVALLGNGEALLVQKGLRQIRASMTDQPVRYFTLEIVPAADATDAVNGQVLYVSDVFTPPSGQRDIDLVRNVLRLNEQANLPDTGQSVYILATDGAIDILPATGEPRTLQAGESGIFTGQLEIKAVQPSAEGSGQIASIELTASLLQDADSSAGYVVAVIGTEIGPIETPTAMPTVTPTPLPTEEPTEIVVTEPTQEATVEPTAEPTLEPTATDEAPLDSDADGLSDRDEVQYGTDPAIPDTDNDGLNDGDEVFKFSTQPRNQDSDSDALSDGEEVLTYGTDPLNPDTDGGGLPDGREIASERDPLNSADDVR